jgi:predicted DNA-binding transcriptional regulator YafY
MRADRLLSCLLLLQAHGRLTGRDLARRLEVSERTVHRDMEALSAAGVPVFAERGARGGWQLTEGWQTTVPGLEEMELRALLMAQPARLLGDLRLGGAAERALGKVTASLPLALRQQAAAMRQRLYIDVEGWRGTTENLTVLPIVQDAVWRDRKLQMRYLRTGHELVERLVDPLGLVAKGSTWYLVARTPDGFRTYRVSRIEQAIVLEEPCARPADFDLITHWKASTATYQETFVRYPATIRVEPRSGTWLRMWRPFGSVELLGDPDPEGWLTMRVQFESPEIAAFAVLGLGPRADVIDPPDLRDRVLMNAEHTAARIRASRESSEGT